VTATYCTTSDAARAAGLSLTGLPSPMIEANITSHIEEAEAVINRICNTTFSETTVTTEYHDGNDMDTLILDHYPITTLTSLTIQGTSITTSKVYVYTGMAGAGKLRLHNDAEATSFRSDYPQGIVVAYKYGYSAVPTIIRRAAANLAARMLLTQQIGGTYDDLTSFSLPELSGTFGEPYTQMRETILKLTDE